MDIRSLDPLPDVEEARTRFVREHTCRSCHALALVRVRGCAETHLLCRSCRRCWRKTQHSYVGVDPLSCPGCADQSKTLCLALLADEFPRFGTEVLS